jgi:hypothetical protein
VRTDLNLFAHSDCRAMRMASAMFMIQVSGSGCEPKFFGLFNRFKSNRRSGSLKAAWKAAALSLI